MTRHVMLNNVTHKNLRVITRQGAGFGDKMASVLTFPSEYGDVQREYPIFFRKDGAGEFVSVALLGFEKDENLFLDEKGWQADYLPAVVARGPFLIGFQEQQVAGDVRREPVIHLDMDDPRVNETEGEPVFLPQGGNSRYLDHIAMVLKGIHDGMVMSKAMFAAFAAANLIEPVNVQVKPTPEQQYDLVGMYTISEERLRALDGEALLKLNQTGFLQGAYLVLASLNNIKHLIELKRRKRPAAPGVPTS